MRVIRQAPVGYVHWSGCGRGAIADVNGTKDGGWRQSTLRNHEKEFIDRTRHCMNLYAWIGEDELGSGEIGIKQGIVPAGMIPMVAIRRDKIEREDIIRQLQHQARTSGKPIRLARFVLVEDVAVIDPHA
jgi:hypothetical protein